MLKSTWDAEKLFGKLETNYIIGKTFDATDINNITLIETYENQNAIDHHKTTPHFLEWRNKVEPYMNSPRQVTRLINIPMTPNDFFCHDEAVANAMEEPIKRCAEQCDKCKEK